MTISRLLLADGSSFLLLTDGSYLLLDTDGFVDLGHLNPSICIELDWTNDPGSATQTWENITPYVVAYSRQPVRTNEFDQPGPASATLVLRNDDNRFLPDNTAGPYYAGLKKFRRVRVRAKWAGTVYDRFWGYCLDWPQSWAQAGKDSTVTLQLVDALAATSTLDLQGQVLSSALSGAAIDAVLVGQPIDIQGNTVGVDATIGMGGPPVLDTGISTIVSSGTLATNSYALQRIRDISASENGVTYADGAGVINFHDRHHRLIGSARSTTVQGTIGDTAGEIPYVDPTPMYGDVWTTVQVTPSGGSLVTSTNTPASSTYLNQTMNFPPSGQYLVSSSAEALEAAQYIVNRYSEPVTRVPSVTLVGARDSTLWPTILGLDTSDLVTFKRVQSWGTLSLDQFVEGYGDQVTVGRDWRVSVALSSVDPQSYWLAGDSRLSLAGVTTRGGY